DIEIAQELHLDFLETGSATALTSPASGIERERARGKALRHRFRLRSEQLSYSIIETEVQNWGRAGGSRQWRLIDHHHFTNAMRAGDRFTETWLVLARLTFGAQKIPVEHIMDQGRLP